VDLSHSAQNKGSKVSYYHLLHEGAEGQCEGSQGEYQGLVSRAGLSQLGNNVDKTGKNVFYANKDDTKVLI